MTYWQPTAFQQIALLAIAVALAGTITQMLRRQWRPAVGFAWLIVLIGGGIAVTWPSLTSRIAQSVGIGRGADLLLYVTVPIMLAGFWMLYLRLRYLRRELTLMVRHIAIAEAERNVAPHRTDAPPATPRIVTRESVPTSTSTE